MTNSSLARPFVSVNLLALMGQVRDIKLLKKIAILLKELRDANDLTQDQVYDDTKIHVGRIETAKANISVSKLSELCKYFNISLSEFHRRIEKL